MLLLGTSKQCITPQIPLRLCGFAARGGSYTRVDEDIFVRVHFLKQGSRKLVFIYGDLIAWAPDFVEKSLSALQKTFSLSKNEVFFVASHNHSGPPSGVFATDAVSTPNPDYFSFLQSAVIDTVRAALANLEFVTMRRFDGTCNLNVYRRRPEGPGATMSPNYDIPADDNLVVAAYYRDDNSIKGILVNYACHANLCGENILHPDYPGIALRMLDEQYEGSVSLFLQGFTGDLRPNSVLGNEFERTDYKGASLFASRFFDCCTKLLCKDGIALAPSLKTACATIRLDLKNTKTQEYAASMLKSGTSIEKDWACHTLHRGMPTYELLNISLIFFAKELSLCTINAEVSQDYSAYMRTLSPHVICAGYTNGMIGYISTKLQIQHGGYEPVESALYFALNGTYPETTEYTIHTAMQEICKAIQKEETQ